MTRDEALKIIKDSDSAIIYSYDNLRCAEGFLEGYEQGRQSVYDEPNKAMAEIKRIGYEQGVMSSAKFLRENGWNDTSTTVNQRNQAFAYAIAVEAALLEKK